MRKIRGISPWPARAVSDVIRSPIGNVRGCLKIASRFRKAYLGPASFGATPRAGRLPKCVTSPPHPRRGDYRFGKIRLAMFTEMLSPFIIPSVCEVHL